MFYGLIMYGSFLPGTNHCVCGVIVTNTLTGCRMVVLNMDSSLRCEPQLHVDYLAGPTAMALARSKGPTDPGSVVCNQPWNPQMSLTHPRAGHTHSQLTQKKKHTHSYLHPPSRILSLSLVCF